MADPTPPRLPEIKQRFEDDPMNLLGYDDTAWLIAEVELLQMKLTAARLALKEALELDKFADDYAVAHGMYCGNAKGVLLALMSAKERWDKKLHAAEEAQQAETILGRTEQNRREAVARADTLQVKLTEAHAENARFLFALTGVEQRESADQDLLLTLAAEKAPKPENG